MTRMLLSALSAAAMVAAAPTLAQQQEGEAAGSGGPGLTIAARAVVSDRDGNEVGTVTLNETRSGTPLVIVALSGLPEGQHGIHLHQTGDCSADDFSSAGGHIAGDAQHGLQVEGGPHPGDLPNVTVGDQGNVNAEFFAHGLTIADMVLDEDGAAFVVHAEADDYVSQPAGNAGDRIACGVLEDV